MASGMNEIDVAIPAVEAGEAVVGHRFGTTLHHLVGCTLLRQDALL
jgi:hypothetical protein